MFILRGRTSPKPRVDQRLCSSGSVGENLQGLETEDVGSILAPLCTHNVSLAKSLHHCEFYCPHTEDKIKPVRKRKVRNMYVKAVCKPRA